MATSNLTEAEDTGTYDGDVLGKVIVDFEANDTCEISVKKGEVDCCRMLLLFAVYYQM